MTTYAYSTTLTVMSCGTCGIGFAVPDDFYRKRRDDHATWYCPNGHGRYFKGQSEAEHLKQQLKWAQDEAARVRAERDQMEASRRAYKGQATRLRNRAIGGECPICGQSLRDLARHMGRKHPNETQHVMTDDEATRLS